MLTTAWLGLVYPGFGLPEFWSPWVVVYLANAWLVSLIVCTGALACGAVGATYVATEMHNKYRGILMVRPCPCFTQSLGTSNTHHASTVLTCHCPRYVSDLQL
jgi:hypothetical protein